MIRKLAVLLILGTITIGLVPQNHDSRGPGRDSRTELVTAMDGVATDSRFTDITATHFGQSRLMEATEQFREKDPSFDIYPREYRVFAYNADPQLTIVASPEVALGPIEIDRPRLEIVSVTIASVAWPGASASPQMVSRSAMLSMQWNLVGSHCLSSSYSSFGKVDTCWHIYKLVNESDPTKDYYAFRHFGTAGPTTSGAWLTDAWLMSWQHGSSSTMAWVDWDPGSDVTSNCTSVTVSVTALGIGLAVPYTRCETWDITKGSLGGYFANDWNGSVQADRQVAYQTAISVAQGGNPVWGFSYSHTTCMVTWAWQCSTAP